MKIGATFSIAIIVIRHVSLGHASLSRIATNNSMFACFPG